MGSALLPIGLSPSTHLTPTLLTAPGAKVAWSDQCDPGSNYFGTSLCPESLPTPVNTGDDVQIAGAIVVLGILILLVIFQALRPLLPERRAPQRQEKRSRSRSQEKSSPLPFLLALSPILLFATLVVSMGLQLWEITGVVVALMAGFGLLAVVGIRYALGVHTATEVVQNANDSGRFYLINRFVPSIDTFAGKVEVVQSPRKRRRTMRVRAKQKR